MGAVNYEIDLRERDTTKIVHCNLLRRWHARAEEENTSLVNVVEESDDIISYRWEQDEPPQFGDQLTLEDRRKLQQLLKQYPTVMARRPGRTTQAQHQIVTGDAQPVRQRPYRIPPAVKKEVCEELKQMLEDGLIEESSSDWSSPLVIVRKKDGSSRICVDYRRLNAVTRFDAYPMPRVDELLDQIGNAKYISMLDLAKGYWQVPMATEDRVKTAFSSPMGLYQYTVMPFGLSGAPATFQRMMDTILRGLEDFVGVYIDDVVIYSSTLTEHLQHLQSVLERLQQAGLTLKLKKCKFGAVECTYLGHQVGMDGVKPELSKIIAIQQIEQPHTKKDVRIFLGMMGYYRRFIRNYATLAEPLTKLTKKREPNVIEWSAQAEQAFQALKNALTSDTVMRSPDFTRTFVVQTDASGAGVGAVLSQAGDERPIAYFSKKLLDREQKYSAVEQECLAIVISIKAFEVYLIGRPFVLQTDHRALQWLHRLRDKNARLMRWSLILQPFTFTVQHRKGSENANADTLSRLPVHDPCFALKNEGGNVTEATDRGYMRQPELPDHTETRDVTSLP